MLKFLRSRQAFKGIPEVKEAGTYWFKNDAGEKFIVWIPVRKVREQKKAIMLKFGTDKVIKVKEAGIGEFIGPIHTIDFTRLWRITCNNGVC